MAKVGSLSVYNSLKRTLPTTAIYHTHILDIDKAKADIQECFDHGIYPGSRSPVVLIQNQIIFKKRPFKVISLFRDPIDRNISAFFDAFQLYVGVKPQAYIGSLEDLEALFHKHLPYTYPLNWFETIFLKDFDIDVYAFPFDVEKGYATIEKDGKVVLLMNCYVEDVIKEQQIAEFCDLDNFKLTNSNITDHKSSRDLYRAFKDFIRFDRSYLEAHYNSKYARHFFTETHRNEAMKRWLKLE